MNSANIGFHKTRLLVLLLLVLMLLLYYWCGPVVRALGLYFEVHKTRLHRSR